MTGVIQRAGIIGDVHAEDHALERALGFFIEQGCDAVLCVGDVVDGKGNAERACRLLATSPSTFTVLGNHDRWFLSGAMRDLPDATATGLLSSESRAFLDALPTTKTLQTAAGQVLLCHGMGSDDMATLRPDDEGYALEVNTAVHGVLAANEYALVVSGHSHRSMVRSLRGVTFINAGTLAREHDPCVVVADFVQRTASFFRIATALQPWWEGKW